MARPINVPTSQILTQPNVGGRASALLSNIQQGLGNIGQSLGNIGRIRNDEEVNNLIARGSLNDLNEQSARAKLLGASKGNLTEEGQKAVDSFLGELRNRGNQSFQSEQQKERLKSQEGIASGHDTTSKVNAILSSDTSKDINKDNIKSKEKLFKSGQRNSNKQADKDRKLTEEQGAFNRNATSLTADKNRKSRENIAKESNDTMLAIQGTKQLKPKVYKKSVENGYKKLTNADGTVTDKAQKELSSYVNDLKGNFFGRQFDEPTRRAIEEVLAKSLMTEEGLATYDLKGIDGVYNLIHGQLGELDDEASWKNFNFGGFNPFSDTQFFNMTLKGK